MYATGKDQLAIDLAFGTEMRQHGINCLLPQYRTGARAHMAAAFTPLEYEPSRAAFQKERHEAG